MTFSCLQNPARRAILVAAAIWYGCHAAWAQDRTPVPDAAAEAQARELIHDVYGKEFEEARTSAARTALAKKLLDQATKTQDDPASHYMLLQIAADLATQAGDAQTALKAADGIVRTYEVDVIAVQLEYVHRVAEAAKLSSQRTALAKQALSLVDEALAVENYEAADQFAQIARVSARKARVFPLRKEIGARMKQVEELQEAYVEYQQAMARLDEAPTAAEANLTAGRYLCVARGDWERGVPMLALGSDAALKAVAIKELKGATSADARIALGDGWWNLAETKEGRQKDSFFLRSGYWYEQAQPGVSSALMKMKLQKRLQEIAKIEAPAAQVTTTGPHPKKQPAAAAKVEPPKPADESPSPKFVEDPQPWILLPPLVQVGRDSRDATWKWDGATATFAAGKPWASVSFPLKIDGSYELQTRVTITQAKETTAIGLPVFGAKGVVLDMKGDSGNSSSPTATIRLVGLKPAPQPKGEVSMNIGTEYAFSCKVVVSGNNVHLEIRRDDQVLFQWAGDVSQVAERRTMRPETVELWTAYYTSSQFRDFRLRMLSGQATPLSPE